MMKQSSNGRARELACLLVLYESWGIFGALRFRKKGDADGTAHTLFEIRSFQNSGRSPNVTLLVTELSRFTVANRVPFSVQSYGILPHKLQLWIHNNIVVMNE